MDFKKILNVSSKAIKDTGKKAKIQFEIEFKKSDIKDLQAKIGRIICENNIQNNDTEINNLIGKIRTNEEAIRDLEKERKEI